MRTRTKVRDPLDVQGRLYRQVSLLLEQLEGKEEQAVDVEVLCSRIEKALTLKTESLMRERVQEALDDVGPRGISMRERIAAFLAISRIQFTLAHIGSGSDEEADAVAGSTVRKYSKAFGAKTNVASRRATTGRPAGNVFSLADDSDDDILKE